MIVYYYIKNKKSRQTFINKVYEININLLSILSRSINTSSRDRTDTSQRKRDFESRASANSAILAKFNMKGGNRI